MNVEICDGLKGCRDVIFGGSEPTQKDNLTHSTCKIVFKMKTLTLFQKEAGFSAGEQSQFPYCSLQDSESLSRQRGFPRISM